MFRSGIYLLSSGLLGATLVAGCGDDEVGVGVDGGIAGNTTDSGAGARAGGGAGGSGGLGGGGTSGAAPVDDGGVREDGGVVAMDGGALDGGDAAMADAGIFDPCRGGVELPGDDAYVAPGLCARAVATGQGRLRQLGFAPNGDLFGVTVDGEIRRYRDVDGDGAFAGDSEVVVWADTGGNGNNAHVDVEGGYLYAGTPDGVKRWAYDADEVPGPTDEGMDVLVDQPASGNHTYHTVHVFDEWMYVQLGSEGNASSPASPYYDTDRAVIKRFWLPSFEEGIPFEWDEGELFAVGLRNTVGFTQHTNGSIYGVVNGIDNLFYDGEDVHLGNPGDMLVRIEHGGQYGFPYCFSALHIEAAGGGVVAAGTQLATEGINPHDDDWCAENSDRPETLFPAHSAPLDIVFMSEQTPSLPEEWVGGAFVTLHGSWNTEPPSGYQVVWVPFDQTGSAPMPTARTSGPRFVHEVVFSGISGEEPTAGPWSWQNEGAGESTVRPVGVAISPIDGALYVSSDNGPVLGVDGGTSGDGAIYRIGLER